MPKLAEALIDPGMPGVLQGLAAHAAAVDSNKSAGGECTATVPEAGVDRTVVVMRALDIGTGAVVTSIEIDQVPSGNDCN